MKNVLGSWSNSFVYVIAAVLFLAGIICSGALVQKTYALEEDSTATDTDKVSVVFTHDMHSHMDSDKKKVDGYLTESGGFARLKTVINDIDSRYPDTFVLDAGDFSMGTPYQTIFSSEASELKMMKYIGIEATTFGNHEFDYRAGGLASMLESAEGNGPQLVASNIDWDATLADAGLRQDAELLKGSCDAYGVKDYIIIEKGGVKAAVFGLMGKNAADYAPESGLIFRDACEAAEDVVSRIKTEEDADMIICLSHCGTVENEEDVIEETEDYQLAEAVPDIDLIISGHSHTRLDVPVQAGNTTIVSCGSYNDSAGHVVLEKSGKNYSMKEYDLIALDENITPDESVEKELDKYRALADTEYFNRYGYDSGQVIASSEADFTAIEEFGLKQGEDALGNLIADSYKYAVAKAEKGTIRGYCEGGCAAGEVISDAGGVQIAVVPAGVVRGSFFSGDITVADAFNVSSLGYGRDGLAGYPLVRAYLTGKELKAVAEVDASISDFMGVARLYCSGLEYSWNDNRLILNRAVDVKYNDGTSICELEDDKMYSVVADLYSCQMLGTVKGKSMGLLSIEPKDKDGNPISDYEEHIIYENGREVKAWYALTSYIDSFDNDVIPDYYNQLQGRKTEIDSSSPVELLKQPGKVFCIAVAAVAVLALAAAGIVVSVIRRRKKKRD